jgi:hypothetical protein
LLILATKKLAKLGLAEKAGMIGQLAQALGVTADETIGAGRDTNPTRPTVFPAGFFGACSCLNASPPTIKRPWAAFQRFRIKHENARLYPNKDVVEQIPWPIAG